MPHDSQLDELARKGRQRQKVEAGDEGAGDVAREHELGRRHASSTKIAALALSRIRGLWVASKVLACVVGVIAVVFGVTCAWSLQEPHSAIELHEYKLGLVACVAGFVVFAVLPWILKPLAIAAGRAECDATQRWLASLPFQVSGYLEVIGRRTWVSKLGTGTPSNDAIMSQRGSATEYFDVQVGLHHANEKPSDAFMGRMLDGLGNPFSHKSYRSSRTSFSFNGGPNGAVVAAHLRRLVEKMLVPLHARYPLASVKVFVERR